MNITIPKFKIRRGSDTDRKLVIFDQGEPAFTVDTNRLFVGNGSTLGGLSIASKIHTPINNITSLTAINAQVGDLVYTNNIFYQLTASNYSALGSWINTGTKINASIFEYDSDNVLDLLSSSISSSHLSPTIFGRGISGGNGEPVELVIDPLFFEFDGDVLSWRLSTTDIAGDGLSFDVSTQKLSLSVIATSANYELPNVTIDQHGRVTSLQSSIMDTLTGSNGTGLLSALFSGTPAHTLSGAIPGVNLTTFTAISSNGSTLTLSSAGFLVFQGNTTSRSGQSVGRYAIPIFTF